jgi:colanic acid biosynthesis glycosyl transferase WcaI
VRNLAASPAPTICFFNRSYWPDLGATGQLLTELAEDLTATHGWAVCVVAGRPLHAAKPAERRWRPVTREHQHGVEVLRVAGTTFAPRRFAGRVANYLTYFVSACLAGLLSVRAQIVVGLTDPPIIGLTAWLTARCSRAQFVFLCQDVFPEVAVLVEGFQSAMVNRCLDAINRFLLRRADRVVALGETMRDRLIAKGADPAKVVVIHNWADCDAIRPGPKRNAFSEAAGLAEAFVVMHSGNVGLSQNLDVLLDAAGQLRSHRDIVVAIVGDGVKRAALEDRARAEGLDNVRFFPYQQRSALHESLAAADVFVVSLREGLSGYIVPSKIYGILAAGRPYVAAVEEASEVAAITRTHGCGLLASPGKAADLAEKILRLYLDRSLARSLGEKAREAALSYDRSDQVAAYHTLFSLLVSGRARSRPSVVKRAFDVALSATGLAVGVPLGAAIALAIKLDDGGPIFYSQTRVGKDGTRFQSWKFRSMVVDAERRSEILQATRDDSRITRVGRVLRATALDELPQLWNILRGDMSFVGPRALMPAEIEVSGTGDIVPLEKIPGYEARHRVAPGLTGVAQIYADRDIPRRHKFRYDLLYIRRQRFLLDLRLILLSFWITFRGRWEHRGDKV